MSSATQVATDFVKKYNVGTRKMSLEYGEEKSMGKNNPRRARWMETGLRCRSKWCWLNRKA